jgi:Lon protease-like protein
MKSIGQLSAELPAEAPIMVLPGAVLFPHALMPLFIFEPRYRAMLAHALESSRMFCVALMKPGLDDAQTPADFAHIAGIGLLRACVGRDDGTSHLVLQGLARVHLEDFVQEQPFRVARIRELRPASSDSAELESLSLAVRDLCQRLLPAAASAQREQLTAQLAQVEDPSVLCDVVAHTFLRNAASQQEVLEQVEVAARLRTVLRHLQIEAAD